ncbi:MAG: hypothetical protein K8R23_13045 [Chthoniobacter sp.]|nr:hypothetical protein [Chthoniobacter sp.]
MKRSLAIFAAALLGSATFVRTAEPREVSGIYPQLAMFNEEGECGTGAVVPWAGRLWVVTYAPHKPQGSTDRLYEITPELAQIIRPESIGGTSANRMIHRESGQLFIGPYVVDEKGGVRVIVATQMYGRLTGLARHLTEPAGKICYATMEEGIYEVDVKTLAVTELWADEQRKAGRHAELPGYHGKGFYSAQGRYVYANNGDHAPAALRDPATPSGVLAEWDGVAEKWTVVRRNQFTDVTGPGGIEGSAADAPLWSIGWDHRSLILMLLDHGKWSAFRLPKASHCYDGAHGWNTEWPRIRDIGEPDLLMTMHGGFWKFPRTFSAANTAGIAPRSTYLKVVGDFCRWSDRIVLGCDDTAKSEFLNEHPLKGKLAAPGQSQSNLWFIAPAQLDACGPVLGRGAVWLDDAVKAGVASEPFLFSGYPHRSLYLTNDGAKPLAVALEVDLRGDGKWTRLREVIVPARGATWTELAETGAWLRLVPSRDAERVTAMFHYRGDDKRSAEAAPIFDGLGTGDTTRGVLHARGAELKALRFIHDGAAYDLDGELLLKKADDPQGAEWTAKNAAIPKTAITADAASAFWTDAKGVRWRFPRGTATDGARVCREVCTERNLLNAFGTFYEMPADNAGGFSKIRPIATHNRAIWDYASYRGLLVMSGVARDAKGGRIVRSDDGNCALWVGAVDDLWHLGKPRGTGGPWRDTPVTAGQPSDPYLLRGYDHKTLTLSHDAARPVAMGVEVDITGDGGWQPYRSFDVPAGKPLVHEFPAALSGYWLRVKSAATCRATAELIYD